MEVIAPVCRVDPVRAMRCSSAAHNNYITRPIHVLHLNFADALTCANNASVSLQMSPLLREREKAYEVILWLFVRFDGL